MFSIEAADLALFGAFVAGLGFGWVMGAIFSLNSALTRSEEMRAEEEGTDSERH